MPKVVYLLLSVVAAAHCQHLPPALLWGSEVNAPLEGQVQSTPENVAGTISSKGIIVFMLDQLSLEDFGKFDNLKKIVSEYKSMFFPEVESERLVEYLKSEKKDVEVIYLDSIEDLEKAVLRKNFEKRVGILTARKSSWRTRSKRAVAPAAGKGKLYSGADYLIYLKQANLTIYHHADTKPKSVSYANIDSIDLKKNGTEVNVTLNFQGGSSPQLEIKTFVLKLQFVKKGGYMVLKNITSDIDGTFDSAALKIHEWYRSAVELLYPENLSFHCSKFGPIRPPIRMANHTASVVFEKFQIQVDRNETVFLSAYECVGFFTPGIWMGIFMNLILIAIMTWGIYMIMSVKTMDRFDDPKGKPISFAGSE